MPRPIIDYEKVPSNLLSMLVNIAAMEQQVSMLGLSGSSRLIAELELYRQAVALEIEKQGGSD